ARKLARPSAVGPALGPTPPVASSEAARVVAVQQRMQAASPALLHALRDGNESFVLRELGPREDRVRLESAKGRQKPLEGVVRTMGRVVAWDHLRASGRQGAAGADDPMGVGRPGPRRAGPIDYPRSAALPVQPDRRVVRA